MATNSVTLIGNLTRDPELRYTTGGNHTIGHRLDPGLCLRILDVTIDDDHEFVATHHACRSPFGLGRRVADRGPVSRELHGAGWIWTGRVYRGADRRVRAMCPA